MADNLTSPLGMIATEDDGVAHHQRVISNSTFTASANFNRPANTTAYDINDAIANNTVAGSVTPISWVLPLGSGTIVRARIRKSDQTVATPTIRLWLYSASPTPGAGDNAAFAHPVANCLGYIDVDVILAGSDDAVGFQVAEIPVTVGTVYGLLQSLSVFTPASSETFTVDLWGFGG